MVTKVYERRQLVYAYEVETPSGKAYLVREVTLADPTKPTLTQSITPIAETFVPADVFEKNFKELPDLTGCCG